MTNSNNASNNSIVSIQLKLFDLNDFKNALKEKIHAVKTSYSPDKRVIITDTDKYEYLNPECSNCTSNDIVKEGNRKRIVNFPYSKKHKIFLKKYRCKNCGKYFQTELESILEKNKTYTKDFKEAILESLKNGYISSRKLAKNFEIFWKYSPSHQTIKNIIKQGENKRIINEIDIFSGYYSYDEEYLSLNGEKAYRMTLYDTIFDYPVAEEISYNLKSATIKSFIAETTDNIPIECIITDHVPKYRAILDSLNITHQLCLFHFLKMVTDLRKKELKKNKDNEIEKEKIKRECQELKEIFQTHDFNECLNRFNKFITNLTSDREYLVKFMSKHVLKNFKRMIQHFLDPLIERTTNKSENYFRQTDSDRIKKRFKTSEGILDFLYLKMQYQTEKALKKIN